MLYKMFNLHNKNYHAKLLTLLGEYFFHNAVYLVVEMKLKEVFRSIYSYQNICLECDSAHSVVSSNLTQNLPLLPSPTALLGMIQVFTVHFCQYSF